MIDISTTLKYYKQKTVQEAIVEQAQDKEVAVLYGAKGFGKRPDVLAYPKDVLEFAKQGATSFHCSEELWSNPLQLNPSLKREELDNLRIGWDLILDIDSKVLEASLITGDLIVQALKHHDIENLFVKFSGNHGVHIAVPFQAFPDSVNNLEVKNLFPEGPRRIAAYLKHMINIPLQKKITEKIDLEEVTKLTGLKREDFVKGNQLDPFSFVGIDTVLIASRHLYRMPYSFNEKSGLISIPILPHKIIGFNKEDAQPKNVHVNLKFITRDVKQNEARKLFLQAFDFTHEEEKLVVKEEKEFLGSETAIPENYFPPCVQIILKGLKDGKKRSVFIMINFLRCCGWDFDAIEKYLMEWNKKNAEPLRDVDILGQIRYARRNNKKVLPPNCSNKAYYIDLGICQPDNFCKKIKNPANYSLWKQKMVNENSESGKKKRNEE